MLDALVIGAGPAGLAAALYLARYRRHVRVIHDGSSRLLWVPRSRNVPGFPDGIIGRDLVAKMSEHAELYGAEIEEGRVVALAELGERGGFAARLTSGELVEARGVILATGVETARATLDKGDHDSAVQSGILRYCPICDGYEHRREKIAVLGSDKHGAAEAMFLRQYTSDVTLIPKAYVELSDAQRRELADSDVKILEGKLSRLEATKDAIFVSLAGETRKRRFDVIYPAFGSTPRSELAAMLGPVTDPSGCLPASAYLDGLTPGVYAAGDVIEGLDQISVATGHGAMAATRLHNWLRETDGHVMNARR
ncbi:NAD(P)/FAD-dependent oxidoreductase [Sphingopyxis sp. R3-92]|uniref:NAD(P)/FAD-dependent oxidoreductase n=1 Tax=Sphingopyxis sp. R3-92 TaxID=3158553 RepID=UPI003EE7DA8A